MLLKKKWYLRSQFHRITNIYELRSVDSLEQWAKDKKRTIWFRVHLPHTEWVPILTKQEFIFHHAKEEYVMLYRWLPVDEECHVPKYAHTMLGVGAFVFNKDSDEILVIKDKYVNKATWKLPGGYVEPGTSIDWRIVNFVQSTTYRVHVYMRLHLPGENIEAAAKREVLEETGIQADFKCLMSFRHGHDYSFGCSDIYMIAFLTPQNFEIQKCDREISECRWMKVEVKYISYRTNLLSISISESTVLKLYLCQICI